MRTVSISRVSYRLLAILHGCLSMGSPTSHADLTLSLRRTSAKPSVEATLNLTSCTREFVPLTDTAPTEVLCVKAMIRLYFEGVQNLFCSQCLTNGTKGAYAARHRVVEVWYVTRVLC
jgi:hypothetical protein